MARILLVGPDRDRAGGIRTLLRGEGHHITWCRSARGWRSMERECSPDLVVAAVGATEEVLSEAGGGGRGFPAPVLLVQQESDFCRDLHVNDRVVDRMSSPFMGEELLGRVDALVRVRRMIEGRGDGARRSGAGDRLRAWFRSRLPKSELPRGPYLEVASRLAEWADRRDAFEPGHAERVATLCAIIADGLGMEEDERAELLRAAMLHDIGKVSLPIEMLHQPGPLEESQKRLIRTHPARGAALLRALDPNERVARVVLFHHERPDGTGYYGKPASSVPRAAKVLAVAEAYDAMTNSLLGTRLKADDALRQLEAKSGVVFDADSVGALAASLRAKRNTIPLSI